MLFCAFCMCLVIYRPSPFDRFGWYIYGALALVVGGVLLLASLCVMSFIWAYPLGWVSALLAAGFVAALAKEMRREFSS